MTLDALRRCYEALLARYEAGELDSEAFLLQMQALSCRDAQGRTWTIGARTGNWYVLHQGRWVQAHPGQEAAVGPPEAVPPHEEPPGEAAPALSGVCSSCGNRIANAASFCPYCGRRLADPAAVRGAPISAASREPQPLPRPARGRPGWLRLLPWAALFLLLASGVALAATYVPGVLSLASETGVPASSDLAPYSAPPDREDRPTVAGVIVVVAPDRTAEPSPSGAPAPSATPGRADHTLTLTQPKEDRAWYGRAITFRWHCSPGLGEGEEFLLRLWRDGASEPWVDVRTLSTSHELRADPVAAGLYAWQVSVVRADAPDDVLAASPRWSLVWEPDEQAPTSTLVPTAGMPSPAPTRAAATATRVARVWTLVSPVEGPQWVHGGVVTLRWQCHPGLGQGEQFSLRIVHESSPDPVLVDYRTTDTGYDFCPDTLKPGRYDWEVLIVRADTSQILDRRGWSFSWSLDAEPASPPTVAPPPQPTATAVPPPTPTDTAPRPTETASPRPTQTAPPMPTHAPPPTETVPPTPTETVPPTPTEAPRPTILPSPPIGPYP